MIAPLSQYLTESFEISLILTASRSKSKLELIIYTTLIFVDYCTLLSRCTSDEQLLSGVCCVFRLFWPFFLIHIALGYQNPKAQYYRPQPRFKRVRETEGPPVSLFSWKVSALTTGENKNMIKLIFVSFPLGSGRQKPTEAIFNLWSFSSWKTLPIPASVSICRWYFNNELEMLLNKINVFSRPGPWSGFGT